VRSSSRFVFLVNASAGTGRAPRRLTALLQQSPELASRARIIITRAAAELDAALRLHDDEIPVSVGGDGSFNALVTLMDRRGELQRTLAILPFGTGNATAHTLALRTAAGALAALAHGTTRTLDIMRTSLASTPIALVSCSTGFESNFLRRYSAVRYGSKPWAGISALLLNLPRQLRGVSLQLDGREWVTPSTRIHNVGVYNIPHYAFGKIMWRGMAADDGLAIAATVTNPLWYWSLMARGITAPVAADALEARIPGVRAARWTNAELRAPMGLQIDGESIDAQGLSLTVDARAVTVIAG